MFKILLKSAVLVFIILSVYFIVHPSACSNLMLGRVTNTTDRHPAVEEPAGTQGELFAPAGDQPLEQQDRPALPAQDEELWQEQEQPAAPETPAAEVTAPSQEEASAREAPAAYSQEDIDYAIARRYVELEQEYAQLNKIGKETAKEISYKVMDDFEMTQQEWEAFLQRATQSNLFNRIRLELASGK